MTVQINGEKREAPDGVTLDALLKWLGMPPDRVAVEHNRQIVPKKNWTETRVKEGDRLEVVQLVGGGRPAANPTQKRGR